MVLKRDVAGAHDLPGAVGRIDHERRVLVDADDGVSGQSAGQHLHHLPKPLLAEITAAGVEGFAAVAVVPV